MVSFTVSVVAAIRFATGSSEDAAELSAVVSAAAVSVAAELSAAAVLSVAAELSVAAVELSAEEAPPRLVSGVSTSDKTCSYHRCCK